MDAGGLGTFLVTHVGMKAWMAGYDEEGNFVTICTVLNTGFDLGCIPASFRLEIVLLPARTGL